MPILTVDQLERLMAAILRAGGALEDEAKTVAYHMAKANLEGVDSHGLQYLRWYTENILKKAVIPGAKITVVKDTPVTAVIDANLGWGQIVAKKGMEMAIRKAEKMGVGIVCIRNIHHLGRMWDWSSMAL
jgi:LDH2 family malate/lactate/ureidoglycolate dehydrogenase